MGIKFYIIFISRIFIEEGSKNNNVFFTNIINGRNRYRKLPYLAGPIGGINLLAVIIVSTSTAEKQLDHLTHGGSFIFIQFHTLQSH